MSGDPMPAGITSVVEELLSRTLVLAAHPDDEAIGCGGLLQRMREPRVVFATDGAPANSYFWKGCASAEEYCALRDGEAEQAARELGIPTPESLRQQPGGTRFRDQQLFLSLPQALDALAEVLQRFAPQAVLTHCYEGGHPDHDCCSFLAARAAAPLGIPVWEFPLYTREGAAGISFQHLAGDGALEVDLSGEELERKVCAWRAYASQGNFLRMFDPAKELYRPQAAHDYLRPPHQGQLNYEAWQWFMTGPDLCAAFAPLLT